MLNKQSNSFRFFAVILLTFLMVFNGKGQEKSVLITGTVVDSLNHPIQGASVIVKNSFKGVSTDRNGRFSINVSSADSVTLTITYLGYETESIKIDLRQKGLKPLSVVLYPSQKQIEGVYVRSGQRVAGNMERIGIDKFTGAPNISGGFESLLKLMPGVASSNELSSQYSVRGGNFDENLVYVNDIEVYRPFLIRSAQQEGLSFINPDMVGSVEFSSGGFNAEFGDRMSSVLNVKYREPKETSAKVTGGLLGSSATIEGLAFNNELSFITGVRYKTSKYLLNSLETKGDYNPSFFDWQGVVKKRFSDRFSLGFLGNVSVNQFNFLPRERETNFGVFNNTLQLKIYYDGKEQDRYLSSLGALFAQYQVSPNFNVKAIASSYYSTERETYDLLGQYYLNELDNSMGSKTYGDSLINVGIGGFLDHARNLINLNVSSIKAIGEVRYDKIITKFGVQLQREFMSDERLEWGLVDSSGYAIPYNGQEVGINNFYSALSDIESYRYMGFAQSRLSFSIGSWEYKAIGGIRFNYWTFNNELLLSPRFSLDFNNVDKNWIQYHVAFGYYNQPPFYREVRLPDGTLNTKIKAQQSIHALAGLEYYFTAWGRPFRFSLELYQKWLKNLIPYSIDNVRLRYSGQNLAKGFARGIDVKINGELVPGAESWVSLSLLRTKEDNLTDSYVDENGQVVNPGYYYRPTDQPVSIGIYLQDYLPGNESFKVNLTGVYSSGLPMTSDDSNDYRSSFRMPPYKRFDIGFSKEFIKNGKSKNAFWKVSNLSVGIDVFNLFNFNNTVSYLWVQTVFNQEGNSYKFAVPNYLTSRRINVRIQATF
ncbi:TonB-dependent receptor [Tenuifilum thalassicum]|nr:TonB-dependent receptor [Tenuifilum thalassicum]